MKFNLTDSRKKLTALETEYKGIGQIELHFHFPFANSFRSF